MTTEWKPGTSAYYSAMTRADAIRIAREKIAEWDYEADPHGYCHDRAVLVHLVEGLEWELPSAPPAVPPSQQGLHVAAHMANGDWRQLSSGLGNTPAEVLDSVDEREGREGYWLECEDGSLVALAYIAVLELRGPR